MSGQVGNKSSMSGSVRKAGGAHRQFVSVKKQQPGSAFSKVARKRSLQDVDSVARKKARVQYALAARAAQDNGAAQAVGAPFELRGPKPDDLVHLANIIDPVCLTSKLHKRDFHRMNVGPVKAVVLGCGSVIVGHTRESNGVMDMIIGSTSTETWEKFVGRVLIGVMRTKTTNYGIVSFRVAASFPEHKVNVEQGVFTQLRANFQIVSDSGEALPVSVIPPFATVHLDFLYNVRALADNPLKFSYSDDPTSPTNASALASLIMLMKTDRWIVKRVLRDSSAIAKKKKEGIPEETESAIMQAYQEIFAEVKQLMIDGGGCDGVSASMPGWMSCVNDSMSISAILPEGVMSDSEKEASAGEEEF